MKIKLLIPFLCVLTLGAWGAYTSRPTSLAAQAEPLACLIGFEATVHQGPSAGLALVGNMEFTLDSTGSVNGRLVLMDGSEVPVAGQITGRAVNLVFSLENDQYLFGVGTALEDVRNGDCGSELGGPFVGPEVGDLGDWGKKVPKPTIPPNTGPLSQ